MEQMAKSVNGFHNPASFLILYPPPTPLCLGSSKMVSGSFSTDSLVNMHYPNGTAVSLLLCCVTYKGVENSELLSFQPHHCTPGSAEEARLGGSWCWEYAPPPIICSRVISVVQLERYSVSILFCVSDWMTVVTCSLDFVLLFFPH